MQSLCCLFAMVVANRANELTTSQHHHAQFNNVRALSRSSETLKPHFVQQASSALSGEDFEQDQHFQSGQEETAVLSQFYVSLNGQNWIDQTNWQTAEPICTWYGVTCQTNGRIRSLSLSSNNLRGCPSPLTNLTALRDIDLSGNQVTCVPLLPASVTNVYFARNQLTIVPESLFTFANSRNATDISDNPLSGNIHWPAILSLNRISFLYLDRVGLTVLPENPEYFRLIVWLSLDGNFLTNVYLSSCNNMVSLSVSSNQLSSLNVSCNRLQFLHADHNQLVDVSFISVLANLWWVYFGYNSIEIFPPLSDLSALIILDISNNLLSGTFTLESSSVQSLDLRNNRIQCINFVLANSLTDIRLSNNSLQDDCNLAANFPVSIINLDLSNNQLSYLDFNLTRAPFSILYLDSSNNRITRIVSFQNRLVSSQFCFCANSPATCFLSTTLWLDLSHNLFDGEMLELLFCMNGVVALDLSMNPSLVSTKIPNRGVPPTRLISLDVSFTSVQNIFDFEAAYIYSLFPVLGTVDVSNTPIQCIPNDIDLILPLQFLKADNVHQSQCQHFAKLGVDALALNPFSRIMDLNKSLHCPMYNFVESEAVFQTDPSFFDYVNCTCPSGMAWDYTNLNCTNCTFGVFCNGTVNGRFPVAQDHILKGGYPLDPKSPGMLAKPKNGTFGNVVVLPCLNSDLCNPAEDPLFKCAPGSEGMLCSKCSKQYYALGLTCEKCESIPAYTWTIPLANIIGFIACIAYYWRNHPLSPSSATFSISFFYLQLMNILDESAVYSQGSTNSASNALIGSLAKLSPFALECVYSDWNQELAFWTIVWVPLLLDGDEMRVFLLCPQFIYCRDALCKCWLTEHSLCNTQASSLLLLITLFFVVISKRAKSEKVVALNLSESNTPPLLDNEGDLAYRNLDEPVQPYDGFSPARSNIALEKAIVNSDQGFLLRQLAFIGCSLTSLIYFPLAQRVFWVFNCEHDSAANIDFMSLSPWIACNSQDHNNMKLGAVYLLVVFVVGLPAFLAYRGRRKGSTSPSDVWWSYVTGFMWNSSRTEKWWWQCTIMIRQFLLAMVLGLIDFHSPMVPCLVQSIIVLNLSLTARHWPHLDLYDNRLDFMLMFLALIGYQGSLINVSYPNSNLNWAVDTAQWIGYSCIAAATCRVLIIKYHKIGEAKLKHEHSSGVSTQVTSIGALN